VVLAKSNKSLSATIKDSLEIARFLKRNGFENYIPTFIDQELYLYLLQGTHTETTNQNQLLIFYLFFWSFNLIYPVYMI
jgi:hypothetical protein